MSSLSIRATRSKEQAFRPIRRASPNPWFFSKVITFNCSFLLEKSTIICSNSSVRGPSFTNTTSFGIRLCSNTLRKASLKKSGCSFL